MTKKKKKKKTLQRAETEGLSPWGERHSVTVGTQMCGVVAQGGLKCEPRWWRVFIWLGVAIMWNCVGFKVTPGFDYGVQVVDGINMHYYF